jgi:uncharacterized protein (TIGR00255 family)
MTGFGSKTESVLGKNENDSFFSVEVKSVNSRFFEAICKLPSALSHLEVEIINKAQKELLRGRVYITVKFFDNSIFEEVILSIEIVKGYVKAANDIKKSCKDVKGAVSIESLLNVDGVFTIKSSSIGKNQEKIILSTILEAVRKATVSRKAEGKNLEHDLIERFKDCEKKIKKVAVLIKKYIILLKASIDKQLKILEKDNSELSKMKLDELYSTLNKVDIQEEITRFKSHLLSVFLLFKEKIDEKGKRLDFILQELLREANTIMAKCTSFDISSVCVDIKVELEKCREQTQNVL